ncbi:TetR family transcriptional regulator, partial [Streptomyces acidiscabies]
MPGEESILRRGLEAFAELGYDHASARELARRLGVSHNFINDRYG